MFKKTLWINLLLYFSIAFLCRYARVDKPIRKPPPRPCQEPSRPPLQDQPAGPSQDSCQSPPRYDEVPVCDSGEDSDKPTEPKPPSRSLSLKPRYRGETFKSYVKLPPGVDDRPFPPDKKSPMSPTPSGENPPKIQTMPYRCESVASTSTGRSKFYASV